MFPQPPSARIFWILVLFLFSQTRRAHLSPSAPTTILYQTSTRPTTQPAATTTTSSIQFLEPKETDRADNNDEFEFSNEDDEGLGTHDDEIEEAVDQPTSIMDHYKVLSNKTAHLNDFYHSLNNDERDLDDTVAESQISESTEGDFENRQDLYGRETLYSQLNQLASSISKNKQKGKKANGKSKKLQIVYIKVPLLNLLDKGKTADLSGIEGVAAEDYDSSGVDLMGDLPSEATTESTLSQIAQLANSQLQHQPPASTTQQLFNSLMHLKKNYLNNSAGVNTGAQATVQHNNHEMMSSQYHSTWLPVTGQSQASLQHQRGQAQRQHQHHQSAVNNQNQMFANQQRHEKSSQAVPPYQQQFQQNAKQTSQHQQSQQGHQNLKHQQQSQFISSHPRPYPIQPQAQAHTQQQPSQFQREQHVPSQSQTKPQYHPHSQVNLQSQNASGKYWSNQWNVSNHSLFKPWNTAATRAPQLVNQPYSSTESTKSGKVVKSEFGNFKNELSGSSHPPRNHVYQPAIHGAIDGPFLDDKTPPVTNSSGNQTQPSKKRTMGLGILPIVIQIDTKAMREEQQRGHSGQITDQRVLANQITGLNFENILQQLEHNNLNPHKLGHYNMFNHNQGYQSSASSWQPTSEGVTSNNRTQFPNAHQVHRGNWPANGRPFLKPTATVTIEKPYDLPIPLNHDQPDESQWPNKIEFLSQPFPPNSENAPWSSHSNHRKPKFADFMQQQASTSSSSKHPIFDDSKEFIKPSFQPKGCRQKAKSPCNKLPAIDFDDVFFHKMPGFDSSLFGKHSATKFLSPKPFTTLTRHLATKRQRNKQKSALASSFLSAGSEWNTPPNALFYGTDYLSSASDFAPAFLATPTIPIEAFLPPPLLAPQIPLASSKNVKIPSPKKATEVSIPKPKKFRFWSPFLSASSRAEKRSKTPKSTKA